jgi:hypothetical protein
VVPQPRTARYRTAVVRRKVGCSPGGASEVSTLTRSDLGLPRPRNALPHEKVRHLMSGGKDKEAESARAARVEEEGLLVDRH